MAVNAPVLGLKDSFVDDTSAPVIEPVEALVKVKKRVAFVVVSSVIAKPLAFACHVGADAPLEVRTYPAVPVVPAKDNVPLNRKSVNVPANGVVPPITTLLIVPAVAGLTVTVPVPVGEMLIVALAGFILNAPSKVKLTPPPAPHCKQAAPLAFLKAPPAELAASK